jgi:hypothetical protein
VTEVMLTLLVLVGALTYIAWPYTVVYRLDRALRARDRRALEQLLDLAAICQQLKQQVDQNIEHSTDQFDNLVLRFLRGGVKELSAVSLDAIDAVWVEAVLRAAQPSVPDGRRGLLGGFTFACFERPTRFLVRAGELGTQPVHLYLTLRQGQWRVSGVFV